MRKSVYQYKYLDAWEKFKITALSEKKKDFHSHLDMENITDTGYLLTKRVCKESEKKLEEYHYLYVQSNALSLDDIFENFWNMSWNI